MKRIYYIFFFATLLYSCEKPISESQSENFIKFFGSGYDSKGNDVIQLSDGGYLYTGYDKVNNVDYQVFVGKVDKNGNLVWSNTYGKANFKEEGKVVKAVSDGFLIAGTSVSTVGSSNITHSFILKTNTNGDSLWYKEFGKSNFSITVNDIVATESNIFIAGQSDSSAVDKSDYFVSKLNIAADKVWEKYYSIGSNSAFKKLFLKDNNVVLIGTDGLDNRISIVSVLQSNGNPINFEKNGANNESAADATLIEDQLYLVSNSSQSGTKLSKLNANNSEVWHTESISSITGKTVTYNANGTLMLCGESIVDGNSEINFIQINADGSTNYGDQYFRTLQGTVGKIVKTWDNGLIIVGTTNSTYGTNVQLIKTDKDYFMLKN